MQTNFGDKMATIGKRKREIQDENDIRDNFQYLRHVNEKKKRKLDEENRRIEIKVCSSKINMVRIVTFQITCNVDRFNHSILEGGRGSE